jgi:hypothetical protein
MENAKQVDVRVLRETVNAVLDFIERDLGKSAVPLPSNYYWTVTDDALYSMSEPPKQLDCGSLVDDLEFVQAAYANREQAIPLMLIHLAPLLYALAKAVPSFTEPSE